MNEAINPQETTPQPVINQAPPPQTTQTETVAPPPPKKKNIPVIILSLLLVLALGVAGYFAYMYYQPEFLNNISSETLTTSPTPTPTPTPDPTANLKTYANNSYSFNYSNEWQVVQSKYAATEVLFGPNATNKSAIGGIEVREFPINLDGYIKHLEANTDIKFIESEKTIINNTEWIKTKYEGFPVSGHSYVSYKNGLFYNIYINSWESSEVIILDQILSTYKFTN